MTFLYRARRLPGTLHLHKTILLSDIDRQSYKKTLRDTWWEYQVSWLRFITDKDAILLVRCY